MKHRLTFLAAMLSMAPLASALDLVPFGATWDYMHPTDGMDPALADTDFNTTWFLATPFFGIYNGPAFGSAPALVGPPFDSGTGPAPIGYGTIGAFATLGTTLTTPVSGERRTAYFRHDFTVDADVPNMAIEILADDGAVIYLDGAEIYRQNISGAVADTFLETASIGGSENFTSIILGRLGELEVGDHTIAVSLHQAASTSSDLGFDLRLSDEGFPDPPFGVTTFGAAQPTRIFAVGELGDWVSQDDATLVVNSGGGTEVRSEVVDLSTVGDAVFSMFLGGFEGSGGSNFEVNDTLAARLELTLSGGGTTSISLVPSGFDLDGDGTLNGEEFAPGAAANTAVNRTFFTIERIPADAVSATVVVEGVNNSASESFFFGNALFTDAPATPIALGTADFGAPVDVTLRSPLGGWVESAPKTFGVNGTAVIERLISDPVDVSAVPTSAVSLVLTASETSGGSNFEAGDQFQAFVEVTDINGLGQVVFLSSPVDADANTILTGDEIAPAADVADNLNETIVFTGNLPTGAVSARLSVLTVVDSASETFTVSDVKFGPAAPDFAILSVTEAGGEVDVVWESEAGATYDLQYSADLSNGSFITVETVVATDVASTASHAPGAAEGFYRVSRRP